MSAGNVKRERIQKIKREKEERGEAVDEGEIAENLPEQEVCTHWVSLFSLHSVDQYGLEIESPMYCVAYANLEFRAVFLP